MTDARGYAIVQINIHDHEAYQRYETAATRAAVEQYDGKVKTVDDHAELVEGEWQYGRTVVVEFPSKARALEWYHSPEYQARAGLRHVAATSNMVIVGGLPALFTKD